jgi:hypothetical protein
VKNFLKKFLLTIYAICGCLVLISYYSLYGINDSNTAPYYGIELRIWLLLLAIFIVPAATYGWSLFLLKSFGLIQLFETALAMILVVLFFALLDLLLLFIRTKLLPKLKSKLTKNQREI